MTVRESHRPSGPNRDFGARQYEDMPSLTDHQAALSGAEGDISVGPVSGRQQPPDYAGHQGSEARAIGETARRALQRAGRGPRNALRPDSLIAEELSERLRDDELLDASEILVGVEGGQVLLTGEVPERWMKHRAEDIADGLRGVKEIENRIRVDNGSGSLGRGGAVRSGRGQPGSGFSSTSPDATGMC